MTWVLKMVRMTAVVYLVVLIAMAVSLRVIGEHWWVTEAMLYLPMLACALPLPAIVLALLWSRNHRLLWTQGLALWVILFPLMGLHVPAPWSARGGHSMRLLSHNVTGNLTEEKLRGEIRQVDPDILLLQAAPPETRPLVEHLLPGFTVHQAGQFLVATRFSIVDEYLPPKLTRPAGRSPRFVRYTLDTPLGRLDLFNVHPVSPRIGFNRLQDREQDDGSHAPSDAVRAFGADQELRYRQVETIAGLARAATNPVLIAGDTNLPQSSWILSHLLGDYRDAFAEAGLGFGYSFPSRHPWMRIDRILGSGELHFRRFEVGPDEGLNHRFIWAEVAR